MCHISCVKCHMSGVTCHVSHVACQMFLLFLQSAGASGWSTCYQRVLPRLFSFALTIGSCSINWVYIIIAYINLDRVSPVQLYQRTKSAGCSKINVTFFTSEAKLKSFGIYNVLYMCYVVYFISFFLYLLLEDTARYAGLLLAPAEGFSLWPRLFLPFGQKESLLCFFGPY